MVKIIFDFHSRRPPVETNVSDRLFWEILEKLADLTTPHVSATLKEVEAWHMSRVLKDSGTQQAAADRLGVSRRTLTNRKNEGLIV